MTSFAQLFSGIFLVFMLPLVFPVSSQVSDPPTITLRRLNETQAELCAPIGNVYAKSGSQIRHVYTWDGGCKVIGAASTVAGGDVYCIAVNDDLRNLICTDPLPPFKREYKAYFPIIFR